MVGRWLICSVRSRVRTAVTLAVLPLVLLNTLPVAAGCICADGHFESACRHDLCVSGKGNCGCSCCARGGCCKSGTCCCRQRSAPPKDETPGKRLNDDSRCCTPLVHQAVPTVVTTPVIVDGYQIMALSLASIDMPSLSPMAMSAIRIDFDTGRPPNDLVVTLHRLVI
jgi:hypothetical protein